MGLNYIALSGEVINSPEKKHTPDGQPVTSFNILLSNQEEEENKSGVVKVSAPRKLAEKAISLVKSGDIVFVEGKLYTKTLENRFSQKQKIVYVQATNIEIIKSKENKLTNNTEVYDVNPVYIKNNQSDDDEIPF